MFNYTITINGLEELKEQINYNKKLLQMQNDKEFQKFIKDKCIETLNSVMNTKLGGTTNDEYISHYIKSNHVIDIENGFVIYNDAKIIANVKGKQNDISNYPNGEFNLAMAFEYGVGIIGINTNNPNAWEYNVNNYENGWYLPKEVADTYDWIRKRKFKGYLGLEIYRETARIIEKSVHGWVIEYYTKQRSGK